ncbi:MAG: PIG-L family deacetylase, partial [Blastocatellia bacterium]
MKSNGLKSLIFTILVLALTVLLLPRPAMRLRRVLADEQKPQVDSGVAGLEQELRKLQTTARMIHTTAHPDDEDGGMLAYESRGTGASVLLMTLNRGEGGQNKTGSELFDALGVLRTLELLAADDYYGVQQRFSRVVDFGFSKNANETFTQWKGHDIPLADMVRVIRTFRPDVLVSRFQGAPRDGHGHHQAAGILTPEAFKAAADPNRFPEQIKEGLLPWQPKKLYTDNVRPNEDYTVRVDTGTYDPVLGMSYLQFALEGLDHQLSQGSGGIKAPPGHRYSYYKLLDSTVPTTGLKGGHEQSFFDGIDTSLVGLASRLGSEEAKTPFLKPALSDLQ